jgi:hypothetical protein
VHNSIYSQLADISLNNSQLGEAKKEGEKEVIFMG